jgi:hypothetical protein
MIIKNTSSLSLQIAAAVAIVVVHHLRTPLPPAGHSLSVSAAAIPTSAAINTLIMASRQKKQQTELLREAPPHGRYL